MTFARIFYWCGDRKEGPVMLRSYAVPPGAQPLGVSIVEARPEGYARAYGVGDVAEDALKMFPSTLRADSDLDLKRKGADWVPVHVNGYPIPERPIEGWDDP